MLLPRVFTSLTCQTPKLDNVFYLWCINIALSEFWYFLCHWSQCNARPLLSEKASWSWYLHYIYIINYQHSFFPTLSWLWHKVLVNTSLHASHLPDSRSWAVGGEHGSAPPQIIFQIWILLPHLVLLQYRRCACQIWWADISSTHHTNQCCYNHDHQRRQ